MSAIGSFIFRARSAGLRFPGTAALFAGLRARWSIVIRCPSDARLAFAVSFIWLALYNLRFW
jgi:hypothetical protein